PADPNVSLDPGEAVGERQPPFLSLDSPSRQLGDVACNAPSLIKSQRLCDFSNTPIRGSQKQRQWLFFWGPRAQDGYHPPSFDFRVDLQGAIIHVVRFIMRRFCITISGAITSIILFCFCFVDPAGARSCCRDINECVWQCNREDGSIYQLMECVALCSRFGG